jgi:hypothetical protein
VSRLADGLEFACLDERAFGRDVDVLEKADDVVFAEDGADAVGAEVASGTPRSAQYAL